MMHIFDKTIAPITQVLCISYDRGFTVVEIYVMFVLSEQGFYTITIFPTFKLLYIII